MGEMEGYPMSAELDQQLVEYLDSIAERLSDKPEMTVLIGCELLEGGEKLISIFQKQDGQINGVFLNNHRANVLISEIRKHFPEEKGTT